MIKTKTILLRKVFQYVNFETQIKFLKELRLMYLQNNTYINTSSCTTFRYTIWLNRNYVPIYWSINNENYDKLRKYLTIIVFGPFYYFLARVYKLAFIVKY